MAELKVQIGLRCEENRRMVKDIVSRAISKGALENKEAFVIVDELQVIITDMDDGKTCYLCQDKQEGLRFQAEILDPKTEISEKYSLHCYHFLELGRNN